VRCLRPHCLEEQQSWKVLVEEVAARMVNIALVAVMYSVHIGMRLDIAVAVVLAIVVAVACAIVRIEGENAAMVVGLVVGIVVTEACSSEESMW